MMLSSRLLKASTRTSCIPTVAAFSRRSARPFFSTTTDTTDDTAEKEVEQDTSPSLNTVNRRSIIEILAEEHDMTKAQAGRVLTTVLDTIVEGVSENKVVTLKNFATIQSMHVKAKKGYNIAKKEMEVFAPYERIKFKPSPFFKRSVNNTSGDGDDDDNNE
eukprot:CAMPEP_0119004812 /NCGR_PEP_ID=MMETSP1176-20130426/1370_1 /TAXON_ID=265551 /ORGANISM="Synedropsis recta cf, Strain CCMP1620" /LENGTH=160 /DNA_ID=CAMNT_0006956561 /DNA_START=119 /DNA_END=598 /DNA_ORIENTATION=+